MSLNWRQKTVEILAADPTRWVRLAELFFAVEREIPIHLAVRRQPVHLQADINLNTARWRMFLSHVSPLVERTSCDGTPGAYRAQRTDLVRLRVEEEPCATCGGPRYLAGWQPRGGRPGPNGREYFCLMGCPAATMEGRRGRGRKAHLTLVPYEPDIIDWTTIEPAAEFVVPEPYTEPQPVVPAQHKRRRHRAGKKHRRANGRSYLQPAPKPPPQKPPPQKLPQRDKSPTVLPMPAKRQLKSFIELADLSSLEEIWDEFSFECRGPRFQEKPELVRWLHRAFDAGIVDEYYRTCSFYDAAREMDALGMKFTIFADDRPNLVHVNVPGMLKVLDGRGAEWVARKMHLTKTKAQRDGGKCVIAYRYAAATILAISIKKRLWVLQSQIDALLAKADPSPVVAQPQSLIEMIKHPIQSIVNRFGK